MAPIVDRIREARLRWYGHIIRSADDTVAKTAYHLSPPKKRWLDHLAEDMHSVNIPDHDFMLNLVSEISALD